MDEGGCKVSQLVSKVQRGLSNASLVTVHDHCCELRGFFLILSIDLACFATRIVFAKEFVLGYLWTICVEEVGVPSAVAMC